MRPAGVVRVVLYLRRDGAPMRGCVDACASLYRDGETQPMWSECFRAVAVAQGVVDLTLGERGSHRVPVVDEAQQSYLQFSVNDRLMPQRFALGPTFGRVYRSVQAVSPADPRCSKRTLHRSAPVGRRQDLREFAVKLRPRRP